ncbi:putative E3 ubiquitin-protein ligase ARI9 [Leucoagaricus sp. SymC.cos]|nr:putative E3 ubiquitin-protein ligase ARI9 [Leucoagaricus sp. SymC.cos]
MDDLLDKIYDGKQEIVSSKRSSQCTDKLGNRISASTCGLAALNFARIAFKLEKDEGMQGLELLKEILSRKSVEEITSICDYWKSNSHLEIEELLKVPVFRSTLSLQTCSYSEPTKQRFYDLLLDLDDVSPERSTVVIITRPPEIVACLKTRVADRDVYVVFDSHPRPSHPDGLGFIINPNIKMAATYLSDLLPFDESLLRDPELQWQAQLLGYFSGHVLLPLEEEPSTTEMLLESSLALLSAYADIASEKSRVSELREKVEELERQQRFLEERARHLEKRRLEDYEYYQTVLRIYKRDENPRHKQSTSTSQSRRNSHKPPPMFPSSEPAHRQPSRSGNDDGEWQVVGEKDKGKNRFELFNIGLPLMGKGSQSYASVASSSRREDSPPLRDQPVTSDSPSMPGGLADPLATMNDLDRDTAIAMELQQEFEHENKQLVEQKRQLEQMVRPTFECSICFEEYVEDSVARIDDCNHSFCRECLRGHAKAKIEERRFPIHCPMCIADRDNLKPGVVDDFLIQQIGVSDDDYRIFEELQIASYCVPLHCRRCKKTMLVVRQELDETKILSCPWPGCNYVWCKACQQAVEVGGPPHSCDGSSELQHLMQEQGWKKCPGCQTPVLKTQGCNHMSCIAPACNTHFCYLEGYIIIKGGTRSEIGNAINAHYRKCKLFDYN